MKNKFAGICYVCKKKVDEGEGLLESNGVSGWKVRHTYCKTEEIRKEKNKEQFHSGKPCRKCGTKLIIKETRKKKEKQLKEKYYYTAYYYCPGCRTIYFSDRFKIINNNL